MVFSFVLTDLIVASELPDADEVEGSDGEEDLGPFTLLHSFYAKQYTSAFIFMCFT